MKVYTSRSPKIDFNKVDSNTYFVVVEHKKQSYKLTLNIDWDSYLSRFSSYTLTKLYIQECKYYESFQVLLEANIQEYDTDIDLKYAIFDIPYKRFINQAKEEWDCLELRELTFHKNKRLSKVKNKNSDEFYFLKLTQTYETDCIDADDLTATYTIEKV